MATKSHLNKVLLANSVATVFALALWLAGGLSLSRNTPLALAVLQEATPTTTPTPVPGAHVAIEESDEGVLVNDLNGNGLIDPADTVRNAITYRNSGSEVLTGIW